MKATSFTGVYIDGDRERILMKGMPTSTSSDITAWIRNTRWRGEPWNTSGSSHWPVEWHQHMPLMAWAEYLYTGDRSFLEKHYDQLVAKLLLPLAEPNGLLKAPVHGGRGSKI